MSARAWTVAASLAAPLIVLCTWWFVAGTRDERPAAGRPSAVPATDRVERGVLVERSERTRPPGASALDVRPQPRRVPGERESKGPPARLVRIRAVLSVERLPVRIDAAGDTPPREVGDGTYELTTWTPRLIAVQTDDPRAAFEIMRVDVPEQPPSQLEVIVPSRSDPRLSPLLVRPVDVQSAQPLAAAVLEAGVRAPWEPPLLANPAGELSVPETLWRRLGWRGLVDAIHLPGYHVVLEPLKEPTDKEWRGWAATGRLDVPYARAPAGGRIRVRVLDDDATPVAGAVGIPRRRGTDRSRR
jgi:hypothetical protein